MMIGRNDDVWLSHPSFYPVPGPEKDGQGASGGTQQARITFKQPAHQTDPKAIQKCRRSRWTRGVLVGMDLSQIELRVAALLSGDPSLIAAYNEGLDLHADRAVSIWGRRDLEDRYGSDLYRHPGFRSRERQVGKRINFADLFRAGAETMQSSILGDIGELFSLELFEQIVRDRPAVRPGLWAWQELLIAEARDTGRVLLPIYGQSRAFLGGHGTYQVNEIVNFPVQSTAGNTLLNIQQEIMLSGNLSSGCLPFLNVYDAIKVDCQNQAAVDSFKSECERAVRKVEQEGYWSCLQKLTGRTVPLEYEIESK